MVSQPITSKACPNDESNKEHASSSESKTTARMMNACQSIFIIAAIAYSTTSVDAFSTTRHSTHQRIISTQNPVVKTPAFITNQRKTFSATLFATKKEVQPTNNASKSDDEEWNALLAAFQMYKAAYGDLKVPSRFVVPSMPPWPGTLRRKNIERTYRPALFLMDGLFPFSPKTLDIFRIWMGSQAWPTCCCYPINWKVRRRRRRKT